MTAISYQDYVSTFQGYHDFVIDLIERHGVTSVCEIGGGAHPMLQPDGIEQRDLDVTILYLSERELSKAPAIHRQIVADIADPDFKPPERFGLVFSKMVAEHVDDAERFHRNTRAMLCNGGLAVHFFPTITTVPFLINRMLPEAASSRIMGLLGRPSSIEEGKFPAYYRWCRGPTHRQIERLEGVGFEVVEYRGVFGHAYYQPVAPLHRLEAHKASYLLEHPHPGLTSFAVVVLRRR